MGERRDAYYVLMRNPEGKITLGRLGFDGRIIMDFKEIGWEAWCGLMWLRIRTTGGL
jgi:hypothetical protein